MSVCIYDRSLEKSLQSQRESCAKLCYIQRPAEERSDVPSSTELLILTDRKCEAKSLRPTARPDSLHSSLSSDKTFRVPQTIPELMLVLAKRESVRSFSGYLPFPSTANMALVFVLANSTIKRSIFYCCYYCLLLTLTLLGNPYQQPWRLYTKNVSSLLALKWISCPLLRTMQRSRGSSIGTFNCCHSSCRPVCPEKCPIDSEMND